ncbi:MAG: PH domain-containing protein [Paramuribaculum sp.]|nr:PH domain-containing protein [Paramuribaculum sp.]
MDKVYKSKVAKWYVCFCIGMTIAFIGSIYLCYQSTWILLIDVAFVGMALVLMYDMLLHTDYTISGDKLHIRCGFLFRMDLPISHITEITHKSTILSSPALSAKRIGLRYGNRNWVYVSPKNQEEFISALSTVNPAIQVS